MKIEWDEASLHPLVDAVVAAAIERLDDNRVKLNGRLGYTEPEAAALIGVQPHVLRDCRLRGEISAKKVGKRYIYGRSALEELLDDK